MKNKIFRVYLKLFFKLFCVSFIAASFVGCSHAPLDLPEGTVIVDNTNPKHTIVEFNGACPAGLPQGQMKSENGLSKNKQTVTENGKTYYFSSQAERDRVMQNFATNSRY